VAAKARNLWSDFLAFISKGNVVDLAIGIIIGGAFTAIVSSIVEDVLSPLLGLALGKNLAQNAVVLKPGKSGNHTYSTPEQAMADGAVVLKYGKLLQAIINFLIISAVLFTIVKLMNNLWHKQAAVAEKSKPKTKQCPWCCETIPSASCVCKACTRDVPREDERKLV
jgi:large conductance mechanosensitive channel